MDSKHEFKKNIYIKNCTGCYFNDIMRVTDMDFNDILLNEKTYKSYEKLLIYDVSYKTFMAAKPLGIRFDKTYGFIKIYNGIRYLVLFAFEQYDAITIGLDI